MGRLLEKYQVKWLEEGRGEERLNLAKALLKDRMSLESVSKYTGLSLRGSPSFAKRSLRLRGGVISLD